MNAATVTQGLICHVFNKLYHQRSTRVRLNCSWIRRKQTKLESHHGKKNKKTTEAPSTASQRSVFSTSHVLTRWSLRRDHRQPRLEILTDSPCFKPNTDCNIHFIPEYKRTISPWNLQTYCASPEQAAVRHDGEWNTKNTNKSRIRGDSEEKKIIPAYTLTFSDIYIFHSLLI